jgi:hypothetical protein
MYPILKIVCIKNDIGTVLANHLHYMYYNEHIKCQYTDVFKIKNKSTWKIIK